MTKLLARNSEELLGFNRRTRDDEPKIILKEPQEYTKPFCDFLTENPTVFHAVDYFRTKLEANGFKKVRIIHTEYGLQILGEVVI